MNSRIQTFLHVLAFALLLLIAALPLAMALVEVARADRPEGEIFVELGARQYLLQGAAAAVGSAALAALAGTALAMAGVPRRMRWLGWAGLIPLVVPPTVYAIAWNALWPMSQSPVISLLRVVICMGLAFSPLVFAAVLAARSLQDPAMAETARMGGMAPLRRLFHVELSPLLGTVAAAALAVFLLSFSNYEMPAALSYNAFPEAIYQRFQQTNSIGAPALLAVAGIAPAAILAWLAWRHLQSHGSRSLVLGGRSSAYCGRHWFLVWIPYLLAAVVLPAGGLLARIQGKLPLQAMWPDLEEGMRHTLPVVLPALVICLLLGWVLADVVLVRKRTGLIVVTLAMLATGVAPAVLGIGIIRTWIQLPEGGFVYGTNKALILALLARYMALPVLIFAAARRLMPPDFEDSARLARVGYLRRTMRLTAPSLAMVWIATAVACMAFMLGELGATTLLSAPGTFLLSYRLHSRIHIGPESYVAAFSVIYGIVVLALSGLLWRLGIWIIGGGRRGNGIS